MDATKKVGAGREGVLASVGGHRSQVSRGMRMNCLCEITVTFIECILFFFFSFGGIDPLWEGWGGFCAWMLPFRFSCPYFGIQRAFSVGFVQQE